MNKNKIKFKEEKMGLTKKDLEIIAYHLNYEWRIIGEMWTDEQWADIAEHTMVELGETIRKIEALIDEYPRE